MNYNPYERTRAEVKAYFTANEARFPGLIAKLDQLYAQPTLKSAQDVMAAYFAQHQKDDIESLRIITSTFANKRMVASIVDSIINDDKALADIAARSYPHPIGFDKLVLYSDENSGFKFRLHIYWRGNQRAVMERMHLHRFEMASAIVTGELTNHTWRVSDYRSESPILPGMEITGENNPAKERKKMHAYSGYWRDPQGLLHKKFLGEVEMERGVSDTFHSGQSYAQILSDAHYVETNAETGKSNGDVCSTIYIHSGGLKDAAGRKMPVLFEDFRLANSDQIIDTIPAMTAEGLKASLQRYRDLVQQSIDYYEWLYDPKHGRNLSVGMIAGYLLSEGYGNPHTISMWIDHEKECKDILRECNVTLRKLVRGEMALTDLSDDDRTKRYYAILLDKAAQHPQGPADWLDKYGDLVKEMWRYCGAIKGEKPDVTVLKPIWSSVVGKRMPGGAHYGHIAAMIEAAYEANDIAMRDFRSGLLTEYKADGSPVSTADAEIENSIRKTLAEYYPDYAFAGEESGVDTTPPAEGARRFLVDPIDGTRNFLNGRDDFCVSIACQEYKNGTWETTDGVVSIPVSGKIYWAEKGKGAYLIERNELERELSVAEKPHKEANPLKNALIDISISGFGVDGEAAIIRDLRTSGAIYRGIGTAAMMMAMVAGKASDGVVLTAHDYDIEAARLIAVEAGATLSQFDFTRDNYTRTATITAANPLVHKALLGIAHNAAFNVGNPVVAKRFDNWPPSP